MLALQQTRDREVCSSTQSTVASQALKAQWQVNTARSSLATPGAQCPPQQICYESRLWSHSAISVKAGVLLRILLHKGSKHPVYVTRNNPATVLSDAGAVTAKPLAAPSTSATTAELPASFDRQPSTAASQAQQQPQQPQVSMARFDSFGTRQVDVAMPYAKQILYYYVRPPTA